MEEDCSNCKYHSRMDQPRSAEVAIDEFIQTSDETDVIYSCKFPGEEREVGKTPIFCENYCAPIKKSLAQIDEMIKRFDQRNNSGEGSHE